MHSLSVKRWLAGQVRTVCWGEIVTDEIIISISDVIWDVLSDAGDGEGGES